MVRRLFWVQEIGVSITSIPTNLDRSYNGNTEASKSSYVRSIRTRSAKFASSIKVMQFVVGEFKREQYPSSNPFVGE